MVILHIISGSFLSPPPPLNHSPTKLPDIPGWQWCILVILVYSHCCKQLSIRSDNNADDVVCFLTANHELVVVNLVKGGCLFHQLPNLKVF